MQGLSDLTQCTLGELLAELQVGITCFGGDGEPRWDGDTDPGHVAEVGALSPEQTANVLPRACGLFCEIDLIESVYPRCH